MKLIAGFVLGIVLGIAATAALAYYGQIAPLQMQIAKQESEATQLRQALVEAQNQLAVIKSQQQTAPASAGYAMLDMVHPGLGTLAQKLQQAVPARQTFAPPSAAETLQKCSAGQIWAVGRCVTCNPGLTPGFSPDGSFGCVRSAPQAAPEANWHCAPGTIPAQDGSTNCVRPTPTPAELSQCSPGAIYSGTCMR